jgi:tetratricopeptide (TPR) repeat protein
MGFKQGAIAVGLLGAIAVGGNTWGRRQAIAQAQEILNDPLPTAAQPLGTWQRLEAAMRGPSLWLDWLPAWADRGADQQTLARWKAREAAIAAELAGATALAAAETEAFAAAVTVQNPPHPLAVWQRSQQQWQRAIALLQAVPAQTQATAIAQTKLASYQRNEAAIAQRVRLAQTAVTWNNRGVKAFDQGNYPEARRCFDQAVKLNPALATAYFGRGLLLATQNSHRTAIADYDRAIALDPQFADGFYHRGRSYSALGSVNGAIDNYNRALTLQNDHARAYLARGMENHRQGNAIAAVTDLQQSAALFQQQGHGSGQATALVALKRVDPSGALLTAQGSTQPTDTTPYGEDEDDPDRNFTRRRRARSAASATSADSSSGGSSRRRSRGGRRR